MGTAEGGTTARIGVRQLIAWQIGAAVLLPHAARAQVFSLTSDISGAAIRDVACSAQPRVSMGEVATEARAEWPLLHLSASGLVGSTPGGHQFDAQRLRGSLYSPTWRGLRVEASMARSANEAQCFSALPLHRNEVRVSRGGRRAGIWVALSEGRGAWFDTLRIDQGNGSDTGRYRMPVGATRGVGGGVWRNVGGFLLAMSIGSRSQTAWDVSIVPTGGVHVDSVWSDSAGRFVPAPIPPVTYETRSSRRQLRVLDSELRLAWARGPIALDVRGGGTFLHSPDLSAQRWTAGSLSIALTPQIALVGEVASQSAVSAQQPYSHRRGALGLRFTTASFSRHPATADIPARGAATAFRLHPAGPGVIILAIRAPHARVVEVTGDFLAWRPVRMQRTSTEWWEVRVAASSGTHRLNVRLDGASWVAPPGVPTMKDEFGGEVGVILVP